MTRLCRLAYADPMSESQPPDSSPSPTTRAGLLSKASLAVLFASFGYIAIRFILTPVRIKILTNVLDEDQYGTVTLVIMTISFIVIVSSMGSLEFMLRKLPGTSRAYQYGIMKRAIQIFGGFSVVVALLGIGILLAIRPTKFDLSGIDYVLCGAILVVMTHLEQRGYFTLGQCLYARSRMTVLLYADGWLVPVLWFLLGGEASTRKVLCMWGAWLVLTVFLTSRWVPLRRIWKEGEGGVTARELLMFGLPAMPLVLGQWLFRLEDRYILMGLTDMATQANYGVCMNIAFVGFIAGTGILDLLMAEFNGVRNQHKSSDLAELSSHEELRKLFSASLRFSSVICIPLASVLIFAGPQITRFLTAPKFYSAASILPYTAAVPWLLLLGLVFGRTLMALNRIPVVGASTLVAAGANVPLNFLLIPRYEAVGAALATTISVGLLALFLGWRAQAWKWIDRAEWMPARTLGVLALSLAGAYGINLTLDAPSGVVLAAIAAWCGVLLLGSGMMGKRDLELVSSSSRRREEESAA